MASDIKKFVNPKFLSTIDLGLMRELFARHFGKDDIPVAFDGESAEIRAALTDYFEAPITRWSKEVIAVLHRVADLGTRDGLQIVLNEARRQGVVLYPELAVEDGENLPAKHEPKHVALHVYLHHPRVFEAAADFQALRAPTAMAEFRGPKRDVGADLTEESTAAFKTAIVELLTEDLHGDYYRLGSYEENGEINLVVSHGTPVSITPIVVGKREEIVPLRQVKYAVLRYSPAEGLLRISGVAKARQADVAAIFARHILMQPDFFSGKHARDLYTLAPIAAAGPDFAFQHAFDENIIEVRIVSAAADLFAWDEAEQMLRYVRSWESRDASGAALRHFRNSEVRFDRGWRLGEIRFRVFFRTDSKRPAQVTVRLKPPGTLAFCRTRFEAAIHRLVALNGLEKERSHDADLAMVAAE